MHLYKKEVVFVSFFGILSAIISGITPYILGIFFDAIVADTYHFIFLEQRGIALWQAALIVGFLLNLLNTFSGWVTEVNGRNIATRVRTEYIARGTMHLLRLPIAFHKKTKIGSIFEKLSRAGSGILDIIGSVFAGIAPPLLSIIIALLVAFFVSPLLTGIILVGALTYILVLSYIAPPLGPLQKKTNRAYTKAFGLAHDVITNAHMVKRAAAESFESKRIWRMFVTRATAQSFYIRKKWAHINSSQTLIAATTQFVVLFVSVNLYTNGTLSLGGIVSMNTYTAMVFRPLMYLGYHWESLQSGLHNIVQAEKILQSPSEIYIPKNAVLGHSFTGAVHFKNVSFAYPDDKRLVVHGLNFRVNAGNIIALVGKSGVGKSTVTELLSGYYFPTKGDVLLDEISISRLPLTDLRKKIAVVPQEVVLFNDTVLANIRYGSFGATNAEVEEAARRAFADEFIQTFPKKYKQVVGERGIKLSVGQKQRIAIARAILKNPAILILDEPTSALDAETESYITRSLEGLMEGRTTFVVAHRLSTVRRADNILVFDKGTIAEQGTHQELIAKDGLYANLHTLQTEWY